MDVSRKIPLHPACCRPRRDGLLLSLSLAMFFIGATALAFFTSAMKQGVSAKTFFLSTGFIAHVFAVVLFPVPWRRPASFGPSGTGCATSLRAVLGVVCLLLAAWEYGGMDGFPFGREHKYWTAGAFLLLGSGFLMGGSFLFVRWRQGV
ncbi:MAG TPA: hypothetical protein VHM91_13150 [Verrucomicrobiales bacterium]|nr:hypothetical protein [Verrucomicrobiales bacterium]